MIGLTLRHRFLVGLLLAGILLLGWDSLTRLPIDALPDLTNNQVSVIVEAPGLVAQEVETQVTLPIETGINGVPGIVEMRSISKLGLSIITVVFEDRIDPYFARQQVQERLQLVKSRLPEGLTTEVAPLTSAMGEVYQYLVEGPYPLDELKTLQDWVVKPALRQVAGVNEVNSWGGHTRQYQVVMDPTALVSYGLTVEQVAQAVQENNRNFSAGGLVLNDDLYALRGQGRIGGLTDLAALPVVERGGIPIRLSDVAEVRIGRAVRYGSVGKNGQGEVVSGMVLMLKGENALTVIERIKAQVAALAPSLPPGVEIRPFYDQTDLIKRTIRTVQTNLLEGALLVIVVLFLFLRSVVPALIVAVTIPASLIFAFIGMRFFGIPANIVSLGAMDFGMIVDGAIVLMESIMRRRHERPDEPLADAIREASRTVIKPVVYGVAIITVVYLPILSLSGIEGKMFRPMAITVALALLGSLLLTVTLVPLLSVLMLKRFKAKEEDGAVMRRLQTGYRRVLTSAFSRPRRILATAVTLFGVAVGSLAMIGTEFMPTLDEGDILIETRKLPSIDLEGSTRISHEVEKAIMRVPEVSRVVTKLGRPDLATESMGLHEGDLYLHLKPQAQWRPGLDKAGILDELDAAMQTVPGVRHNFSQPIVMRVNELVSGVKADVAVKVFGEDFETLERLATAIEAEMVQVPGARDINRERTRGSFEWRVVPRREAMAREGVTMSGLQQVLEAAGQGIVATDVLEGQKRFELALVFPDAVRRDPFRLAELPVATSRGPQPLSTFVDFQRADGPDVIKREAASRRVVVSANVRDRDLGGFVAEAQARIGTLPLPVGYRLDWGGQFENQQRAMSRLALVVPMALGVIASLLYLHFRASRRVLLIMTAVPMAMIGGVAALWLREFYLNVSGVIGFIALFGVSILHGLVMVTCIDDYLKAGVPVDKAIIDGAVTRLRPVLMTALVASLGFVPMALSTGAGAEVQKPLATVVIGGMVTSTALTLLVLPLLYRWWVGRKRLGAPVELETPAELVPASILG